MNITENLNRIQQAKSDIRDVIIAKGGTVSEDANIDEYAGVIESLPSGGSAEIIAQLLQNETSDSLIISNESTITSYRQYALSHFHCNDVKILNNTKLSKRFLEWSIVNNLEIGENVPGDNGSLLYNATVNNLIFNARSYTSSASGTSGASFSEATIGNVIIGNGVTRLPIYFMYQSIQKKDYRTNGTIGLKGSGCDIELPDSLIRLEALVFYQMSTTSYGTNQWLKEITLPSNVNYIGDSSISGNSKLTTITMTSTTPPSIHKNALTNNSILSSIYVPDDSVDAYKSATNWSKFSSIIKPMSEKPTDLT